MMYHESEPTRPTLQYWIVRTYRNLGVLSCRDYSRDRIGVFIVYLGLCISIKEAAGSDLIVGLFRGGRDMANAIS